MERGHTSVSQRILFTTPMKCSMPLNTLDVCHDVPGAPCCRSALVLSDWATGEPAAEGANRVEYEGKVLHDSALRVRDSESVTCHTFGLGSYSVLTFYGL